LHISFLLVISDLKISTLKIAHHFSPVQGIFKTHLFPSVSRKKKGFLQAPFSI